MKSPAPDFRDEADAVSSELLASRGLSSTGDLTAADCSLCVRTPYDAVVIRAKLNRIRMFVRISAIAINIAGIVLLAVASGRLQRGRREYAAAALSIVLMCGSLMMLSLWSSIERLFVRNTLARFGAAMPESIATEKPFFVRIRNPEEEPDESPAADVGFIYCDARRALILMEGLFFRCVIRGRDVVDCRIRQSGKIPQIPLQVRITESGTVLSLLIKPGLTWPELRRRLAGGSRRTELADVLERTLGIAIPPSGNEFVEADAISSYCLRRKGFSKTGDLTAANSSLCVRTEFDADANRRKLRLGRAMNISLAIILVVCGVWMIHWAAVSANGNAWRIPIAVSGSLSLAAGLLSFFLVLDIESARVRKMLRRRGASFPELGNIDGPILICIVNPTGPWTPLSIPPDLGLLFADSRRALIGIEGIFFRYGSAVRTWWIVGCINGRESNSFCSPFKSGIRRRRSAFSSRATARWKIFDFSSPAACGGAGWPARWSER